MKTKNQNWWNSLSQQWQRAFSTVVLNKKETEEPTEAEIEDILNLKVLRIVGPKGPYSNFDKELTDLSGLTELKHLEILILTYHKIKGLSELEYHKKLQKLYINNNEIDSLTGLENLANLDELYCQINSISDLKPLKNLLNLITLYCSDNNLTAFDGLNKKHSKLKEVRAMPNEFIGPKQIRQLEDLNIFCK
jgi:hypothetical protein